MSVDSPYLLLNDLSLCSLSNPCLLLNDLSLYSLSNPYLLLNDLSLCSLSSPYLLLNDLSLCSLSNPYLLLNDLCLILVNFYRCIIESILTNCVTVCRANAHAPPNLRVSRWASQNGADKQRYGDNRFHRQRPTASSGSTHQIVSRSGKDMDELKAPRPKEPNQPVNERGRKMDQVQCRREPRRTPPKGETGGVPPPACRGASHAQ
ncbi:unnamed protein product [Boreogadus saida]